MCSRKRAGREKDLCMVLFQTAKTSVFRMCSSHRRWRSQWIGELSLTNVFVPGTVNLLIRKFTWLYRLVNYQKTVQYTIPGLYIMSIYAIIIVRVCVRLQAHVEKNKNFSKEYSFVDTIFTDRSGGK